LTLVFALTNANTAKTAQLARVPSLLCLFAFAFVIVIGDTQGIPASKFNRDAVRYAARQARYPRLAW
jgi:hypothetical protein